jgi:hypothetical protein
MLVFVSIGYFVRKPQNRSEEVGAVEVESQGQMERVLGAQKSQELLTVLKLLDWDSNMVNLNRCEFGLSNDNYKVSTTGKDPLFLKVFGPLTGNINLDELHLQKCNFGPEVIKKFDWGRLEVWVTGRPMARQDCENFDVLSAFAAELAFMHKTTQRNHNDLNFTNILVGANEKSRFIFLILSMLENSTQPMILRISFVNGCMIAAHHFGLSPM